MSKSHFPSFKDQFAGNLPSTLTHQGAAQMLIESILVDVQRLLAERPCVVSWPSRLRELDRSLVNYGLADFAGEDLANNRDREQLGRRIEAVIRKYEPRLRDVHVRLLPDGGPAENTVRFQISARVGSAPDLILFDAQTELSSDRLFQVASV